ncbi:MAG: hypothetical protein DWQ11_11130 [Proteobacteria bacterium]|nr:MAG: hypothetical protein DWQ11_11130 [Pseudomonadota bacterium]
MKTIAVAVLGLGVLVTTPTLADPAHHPDAPRSAAQMPGADMMAARMEMMRAQLERIAAARTDEERQAAMAEHMQAMQQAMPMGGGQGMPMAGCPMMQGGMMGGASGDMGQRMHQMEQRMDMMQMMMQNMMGGRGPMGKPAQ